MTSVSDKTIELIKKLGLKPKPKWHFLLRNSLIWTVTILSVIIGSLSFSVLLYRLVNNDWETLEYINMGFWYHLFESLPYLWLGLLLIFAFVAYYNFRQTKTGYRFKTLWILGASFILSLGLGAIIYGAGFGSNLHHFINEKLPFIQNLSHDREDFLMQPENGLLSGQIQAELSGVGIYQIEDFNGQLWIVRPDTDFTAPSKPFKTGDYVKILGEISKEEDYVFLADRILNLDR